ncbi:MAG TPA: PaaI family thioesterase [Rhizomicrobium sp.]|nr:PaaI family thioesterase [Rhizomicrobium sp.]
MSDSIPAGFAPLRLSMGFLDANGPLFGRWTDDRLLLGFRVETRHCNPGKVAHGGMLATFADMLLPIAARLQSKAEMGFLPTVNLTCDFLAPAPLGAWVEGRADALTATRNLLFAQGVATADGIPCLRANGIFKIASQGSAKRGDFLLDALFGIKD